MDLTLPSLHLPELAFVVPPTLLLLSACGARSGLAEGRSGGGTGGVGGAGGSCAASSCAPAAGPGSTVWSRLYGTGGQTEAANIVVDGQGGLVVAGSLFGGSNVDLGCGPLTGAKGASGMFVARFDACHACVWSRSFEGVSPGVVAVDAQDGVAVAGTFQGGTIDLGAAVLTSPGWAGFVVKLDGAGTPLWAQGFATLDASSTSETSGVAVDGSGNVLVTGTFAGSIHVGGQVLDSGAGTAGFAVKLGPDGTPVWSRSFGPNVSANAAAIDAAGDLVITGTFETPVDFGCGTLQGAASGYFQPFVVELDPGGACRWSRWFSTAGAGKAYSLATDASSGVVVSGTFDGAIDFGGGPVAPTAGSDLFVAALHADGSTRWGKGFGHAEGGRVAESAAGDVFFEGLLMGSTDFGAGPVDGTGLPIFVASLDTTGGYRWAKTFASGSSSAIGAIAVDPSTAVFLAGGIGGETDFGCGSGTSGAEMDVFVTELRQ